MRMPNKIRAVEKVFANVDKKILNFKQQSGLNCVSGCGFCCTKPDLEATVLEFLPLAYHLYKSDQAEKLLQQLEDQPDTICVMFKRLKTEGDAGFCSAYQHRGLICRLFGFSGVSDKYGKPVFSTCKKIKENFPELYQKVNDDIRQGLAIPMMRNSYFHLQSIDQNLTNKYFPVNLAIKYAIETVLMYYFYRVKRVS